MVGMYRVRDDHSKLRADEPFLKLRTGELVARPYTVRNKFLL